MPKTRFRPPSSGLLALGALILPFLVGFDFPDSSGTSLKASAGGGRYRFTPMCSRYTYGTEFQEAEFEVEHRNVLQAPDPAAPISFWSRLKPSRITFGGKGDFIAKRITVLSYDTDPGDPLKEPWTPPAGYPALGDRFSANGLAVGLRTTLDWKWAGGTAGLSGISYGRNQDRQEAGIKLNEGIPVLLPIFGLRLGDEERLYVSMETFGSSPIASGGGFFNLGLGGRIAATRLWAGVGAEPYRDPMAVLKVSQALGPMAVSFAGQVSPDPAASFREYGFSFGFAYLLPVLR